MSYLNLNADSSDDSGDGGNNGARCTNSTAGSSRSTDMTGSSYMENSSRTDNNRIRNPDNQLRPRLRLLQRPQLPERPNGGLAQEVTQLPPMQRVEVFSYFIPFLCLSLI